MKLRIRDNTIRLRLTQTEVAALDAGRPVRQTTRFSPAHALSCAVVPVAGEPSGATFARDEVRVALRAEVVRGWARTAQVGIRFEQPVDAGASLSVLVEKDFACLHGEEQIADAYPNPLLANAEQADAACARA